MGLDDLQSSEYKTDLQLVKYVYAYLMLSILDRYIARQILIATIFVAVILSAIVLLTQSLRFLELVINAGASGLSFWLLTILALPRFLEIVVPIGLMAGILFVYNRLILDSELIAMKGLGFTPLTLARPALLIGAGLALFLFIAMAFIVPYSNAHLQEKRYELRAALSTILFREGVFNQAGKGLMVYVRARDADGTLHGLIVHDGRGRLDNPSDNKEQTPSTIIATKGVLVATDTGQQVIVYNGSRQDFDESNKILRTLNFDQYTIDLPAATEPLSLRWREPDERTLSELLRPNLNDVIDVERRDDFLLEIHKRISTPFLVLSYAVVGLYFLLLGSIDRRGMSLKIVQAVGVMVLIQILYMTAYNLSKTTQLLTPLMYVVSILPACLGCLALWQPPVKKAPLKKAPQKKGGV